MFQGITFIKPTQYDILKELLVQGNNLYVLGMPGCGKTTLVRKVLQDSQISFSFINFLQCATKESLLNTLCSKLSSLWNIPFQQTNKFSQLALQLSELLKSGTMEQEEKKCYIVLDTPSLPSIGPQSFEKLFNLTNIKSVIYRVNIILISNTLSSQYELPICPKIIIDCWTEKQILEIIYQNNLQYALKMQRNQDISAEITERLCQEFARDVVNTFCVHTKNLNFLLRIAQELSEYFVFRMYSRFLDGEQQGNQINFLKRNDFIEAKKLLLDNPYLRMNTAHFKKLIDKSQNRDHQEHIMKNQYKADRKFNNQIKVYLFFQISCSSTRYR